MRIEMGINPNCSEAIVRFRTDKLTQEQEEELYNALKEFVDKYDYETFISREKVFGIPCIKVNGDGPYNGHDTMMAAIKDLKFMDKVKIEEEE